jgi:hypothetical protein
MAPAHARWLWRGAAAFAAAAAVVGAPLILSVGGPSDAAPPAVEGLPPGYGTALYVPNHAAVEAESEKEAETGQAWTRLAAAIELVRSSLESLTQAESLRGTAARLAQISRENVEARKEESDSAALESARYQLLIAESQLALAEDLLAKARKMSQGAAVIFEIVRQNALQLQDDEDLQEPDDYIRPDPPGLVRTGGPQDAARRSRRA